MRQNRFPAGWDEARVRRVLEHYERQTEDEAVAEDEATFQLRGQAVMVVPKRLVPEITRFIEGRRSRGEKVRGGLASRCSQRRTNRAAAEVEVVLGA